MSNKQTALQHDEFIEIWNQQRHILSDRYDANTLRATIRYANNHGYINPALTGKHIVFMTKDDCIRVITDRENVHVQAEKRAAAEKPTIIEEPAPNSTIDLDKVNTLISKNNETILNMMRDIIQDHKNSESAPVISESEHYHPIYETLYHTINNNIPAMVVGPAGSGKSYIAEQIARALDLPFEYTAVGLQTTKSDLLGYMDANGNYVPTALYRCYKDGGIFLLDEVDAGNPNVFTCLNNLMANGHGAFPCGMVARHKDFRIIAAANTYGNGADMQYVGRNKMDAATKNRFAVITMDYDAALEKNISQNSEWTLHIQSLRQAAYELKEEVVISPRASINGAKLLEAGINQTVVEDMLVWQGINDDVKQRILAKTMGKSLY